MWRTGKAVAAAGISSATSTLGWEGPTSGLTKG
jgi:hypothetical protein